MNWNLEFSTFKGKDFRKSLSLDDLLSPSKPNVKKDELSTMQLHRTMSDRVPSPSSDGDSYASGECSSSGEGSAGGSDSTSSPSCEISLLERLIRTHPVWFLPSLQRSGALHLLQGREIGNFIVRSSTQPMTMAVSVKLPGNIVEHYLLRASDNKIALENSTHTFETVHQLISHYCLESDEIPVRLKVPVQIAECTSRQQLRSLALLGQEFWTHHATVNGKEPSSPSDMDISCGGSGGKNFISSGHSSSSQNSLDFNKKPCRPTTLEIGNNSGGNLGSFTSPPPVPVRWSRSTLLTPLSLPSSIQSTPSEIQTTFSLSEKSGRVAKKKKRHSGGKLIETPSIHYKDTEILDLFKGTKTNYDDKMSDYEDIWSPVSQSQYGENYGGQKRNTPGIKSQQITPPKLSTFKPDIQGNILRSLSSDLDKSHHTQQQIQSSFNNSQQFQSLSILPQRTPTVDSENNNFTVIQQNKMNNRRSFNGELEVRNDNSPPLSHGSTKNVHQNGNNPVKNGKTGEKLYSEPVDSITFRRMSPHRNSEPNMRWSQPMLSLVQFPTSPQDVNMNTFTTSDQTSILRDSGGGNKNTRAHRTSLANINVNVNVSKTPTIISNRNQNQQLKKVGCAASVDNLCHLREIKKRNLFSCTGGGTDSRESGSSGEQTAESVEDLAEEQGNASRFRSKYEKENKNKKSAAGVEQVEDHTSGEIMNVNYSFCEAKSGTNNHTNMSTTGSGGSTSSGTGTGTGGSNISKSGSGNSGKQKPTPPKKRAELIDARERKEEREMMDISNKQWRLDNSWEFVVWDKKGGDDDSNCNEDSSPGRKKFQNMSEELQSPGLMSSSSAELSDDLHQPPIVRKFETQKQMLEDSTLRFSRYDNLDEDCTELSDHSDNHLDSGYSASAKGDDKISQPWDSSKWEHLLRIVSESTQQLDNIQMNDESNVNVHVLNSTLQRSFKDPQVQVANTIRDNKNQKGSALYRLQGESSPNIASAFEERGNKNATGAQRVSKLIEVSGTIEQAVKTISNVVRELANSLDGVFAPTLKSFIQCTFNARSQDPSVVMRNIRQFVSGMKNYLVGVSPESLQVREEIKRQTELLSDSEFLNIDLILEEILDELVILPLYSHIMSLIEIEKKSNGSGSSSGSCFGSCASSPVSDQPEILATIGRFRSTERNYGSLSLNQLGDSDRGEMLEKLKMVYLGFEESFSPLKKLDKWNEFVCQVQEKEDYSSELFLSRLSEMLGSVCPNINNLTYHTDYMIGLLPHSISVANNYSISLFQSAIVDIKAKNNARGKSSTLTCVRVIVPDERNGTLIRKMLPVRESTTNREVSKMIASKLGIANPNDYILVRLKNGEEKICPDGELVSKSVEDCGSPLAYKRIDAKIGYPKSLWN